MSRYTGPRLKVMRALGVDLPGLSRKTIAERNQRPGQHGAKQQRKSGYGLQLLEKQKLRFNYGLSERQMRILVTDARRSRDSAGAKLAELLERRLDNVVFRAGFAGSIPASRQLVNHCHLLVNGKPVNIPSFRVRVGDVVSIRAKSRELLVVKASLADLALSRPEWLSFDEANCAVTVSHLPDINDIPFPLEMQLVVEYYAQRL
ncbi:30S ribosomal protein S4 [Uliginosibacterium sp. 31-16]|uniref:30S ribosomal protein S4 n=1 Tax=Uliginosibacterium sp. 31-16 TaxID=3068315 RepID=UPI00273D5483|nr:30S ribosomal protein S4 [Uliginosibacterium sp. 31-16]MDP5238342.1 30S ribosomal protein S4 [Uliginosibacterium sp. 31-16]